MFVNEQVTLFYYEMKNVKAVQLLDSMHVVQKYFQEMYIIASLLEKLTF